MLYIREGIPFKLLKSNGLSANTEAFLVEVQTQSQEITQSGNMGRETPISFNLEKYVEKHYNGPQ